MKHPAAAAGVLALHLLGLLALAAARPPSAAPDPTVALRPATPGVLRVALHSKTAPEREPAAKQPSPPPQRKMVTAPLPAGMAAPEADPTPTPATAALADAAANAAPAAPAAPTLAMPSAAPPPPPQPSPAPTQVAAAAPAPEPALTLAQADRRDCPPATHPAALRERGIEGEVRLLVRVGTDGRAAEVRLQQTSGWRLFDHAALAQAQACRFVPARRGLQAVEDWVEFPVRFSLRG